MTAIAAFNDWFRKFWGPVPPELDQGSLLTIALAQPWVDKSVVANVKIPSARAQTLADAMTDFRQPGLVGLTFAEYWLGALMDAAGIDPDMEWLAALDRRVLARDWDGALALVKARGTPGSDVSSATTIDKGKARELLAQLGALLG